MQTVLTPTFPTFRRPASLVTSRAVGYWLLGCCVLVFAMVVVGGVTRLTRSGLSIVEWAPIMGTLPPLDAAQWAQTFQRYQATPEYLQVNQGMSLAAFKGIFWWEYVHRLLGRIIGLAVLLPLLAFLLRGQINRTLGARLLLIFLLGGLQGGIGWWMVKSGLVHDPRVSHLRLTLHLGIAFLLYAALLWSALEVLLARERHWRRAIDPALGWGAVGICVLVFVMVLSGGLVAGTHAGLAYNSFPLMNGEFFPRAYFLLEPGWRNALDNITAVQFDHRIIAWTLAALIPLFCWVSLGRAPAAARRSALALVLALVIQVGLGIATLLNAVPVVLGAAHQAGALLLFSAALWCVFEHRRG